MVEYCDIVIAKLQKIGNNIKGDESANAQKLLKLMDKKHGRK